MPAKLPTHQREYAIQLITLGNTHREISSKFMKKYGRPLPTATISRMKKRYKESIDEAQDTIAFHTDQLIGADVLKQKAYKLMDHKLDRVLADETEIEKLRIQLKAGEIDEEEFKRQAASYESMTITELTRISDSMTSQLKDGSGTPTLTPQDQAALSMLMAGINSGNPFQLIQVLNPNVYPTVKSPEPPVDITPES